MRRAAYYIFPIPHLLVATIEIGQHFSVGIGIAFLRELIIRVYPRWKCSSGRFC